MKDASKLIRDFIYVDVERLYSLYSQVFEGVADQIIQSYIDASTSMNSQRDSLLKGGTVEARVAEMSRKTENKFLYDHMYNLFEAKIKNAILESPEISPDNFRSILSQAFMIKVNGAAEIEDYTRLSSILEKYNVIGQAVAYAGLSSSSELTEAIDELESSIEQVKDRNKKAKARAQAARHTDKKALALKQAKEAGLQHDQTSLDNLNMFIELFNPDAFDVTIVPESGENVVFRGAIDKQWLRIEPRLLRSLYGGFIESNWTMVGQVTYLPGVQLPAVGTGQAVIDENDPNPSMRDPYRNIFRTARVLERMFLESKERVEVLVYPLAIYREMALATDAVDVAAGQ